jgi:hypothetical protein
MYAGANMGHPEMVVWKQNWLDTFTDPRHGSKPCPSPKEVRRLFNHSQAAIYF